MEKEKELTPGQRYRKYFSKNLPMTVIFILAVLIVFGLAIIASETLYITIPLLLIPVLFTDQVICADVEAGIGFTNKGITSSFSKYLMGPFRGCYRVIRSFLFALLISLGITALFSFIYIIVGMEVDSSFASALESFMNVAEEEVSTYGISGIIVDYPELLKLLVITQILEGFVFTMTFSHFILSSAPLAILHGTPLAMNRRAFGMIFKGAVKKDAKHYYGTYYGFAWISYLLLAIGYILGTFISIFVMYSIGYVSLESTDNYLIAAVFALFSGIATGMVMMSFSLPYFFYSVEDLTFSLMPAVKDCSLELAKNNLNQLKMYQQISEEEAKRYEEEIKKAEEELNDITDGNEDDKK